MSGWLWNLHYSTRPNYFRQSVSHIFSISPILSSQPPLQRYSSQSSHVHRTQPHSCFPCGVLCSDLASGQSRHRILCAVLRQAGSLSELSLCVCGVSVAGFSQNWEIPSIQRSQPQRKQTCLMNRFPHSVKSSETSKLCSPRTLVCTSLSTRYCFCVPAVPGCSTQFWAPASPLPGFSF